MHTLSHSMCTPGMGPRCSATSCSSCACCRTLGSVNISCHITVKRMLALARTFCSNGCLLVLIHHTPPSCLGRSKVCWDTQGFLGYDRHAHCHTLQSFAAAILRDVPVKGPQPDTCHTQISVVRDRRHIEKYEP